MKTVKFDKITAVFTKAAKHEVEEVVMTSLKKHGSETLVHSESFIYFFQYLG